MYALAVGAFTPTWTIYQELEINMGKILEDTVAMAMAMAMVMVMGDASDGLNLVSERKTPISIL